MSTSLAQEKLASLESAEVNAGLRGPVRVARFLSRAIFFSLLTLIVLVAIPYGTVEPWWEALFECIVFLLGLLWIIETMLSERRVVTAHRIFVPLLLLALYAFIQTLPLLAGNTSSSGVKLWRAISADPYGTRLSILKLLALTLFGIMLLRYASSTRRLRELVFTIIGVGVCSAIFGVVRQTSQHSPGFLLPFLQPNSGYGQFINRNHFAFLMEMVLGLILGLIVGRGVRRDQILIYLSLALPVWAALVLCNSRGGLFSMFAQVLFLALLFTFTGSRRDQRARDSEDRSLPWRIAHATILRPILVVAMMATVFLGAVWIGGESLTTRLETVSGELAANSDEGNEGVRRQEIWRDTWAMVKDHPVLGVGLNGYWSAIPQYHHGSGVATPQQAHNDYLELLASGGLIGAFLAGWFLFVLVASARRSFRSTDSFRRAVTIGACAGLFAVAVHSVVDFGLHVTINALVFTALAVIAVASDGNEDQKAAGIGTGAV